MSGKLRGTLVFRQAGDESLVTSAPVKKAYTPSEAQKKQVSRFTQAITYAKEASRHENGTAWIYTTLKTHTPPRGCRLVIRASDVPGNTTEKEFTIA